MPTIPEWAIAKLINKNTTFAARVEIGKQQQTNGMTLEPGASQVAANELLGNGKLVINSESKIDINPQA